MIVLTACPVLCHWTYSPFVPDDLPLPAAQALWAPAGMLFGLHIVFLARVWAPLAKSASAEEIARGLVPWLVTLRVAVGEEGAAYTRACCPIRWYSHSVSVALCVCACSVAPPFSRHSDDERRSTRSYEPLHSTADFILSPPPRLRERDGRGGG